MKINYIGKCLLIENAGKRILVIGDLHLGYGESLRESGVFMPGDLYSDIVKEMDNVFGVVEKVDEVVLLGDLKHEFGKIMRSEWKEVSDFLDYLNEKLNGDGKENVKMSRKIIIVKGNHDVITGIVTAKKGIEVVDYYIMDGVAFVHGDKDFAEIYDKKVKYWIMGHGHPAVRISDGVKEEKYKCFLVGKWKGKEIVVVPSFFSVNEGSDPRDFDLGLAWNFDLSKFNVVVVGEEKLSVLDFGKLGKIK
ncbi:hypothetical protein AUJ84_03730 [Candidatus Pacearchaeota archaeon CG1_02_32_132]|nr:MAG: hypothetical protein AUJ84_03730 [Candidatus Pacearchaeota archaeon CG1_02_32_132]